MVESEAKIVRKVFAAALTLGGSQIAHDLNMRNVPTRPVLRKTPRTRKETSCGHESRRCGTPRQWAGCSAPRCTKGKDT